MSLFEDYKPRKTTDPKNTVPTDLVIRPAMPDDTDQLAKIAYDRDGGEISQIKNRFKHEIAKRDSTDDRLLLVAESNARIVGFARVKWFKPSSSAPDNICPEGWYLTGVIVAKEYRRRGIASALTRARLDWIAERAGKAYYFANAQNEVSIELHEQFGFVELTRDFVYPDVTFQGGEGILFIIDLA
ncbi:MAG: GNAT family N-acetyltransferase [candidate division Zixibacteria bacterium]|nr:GNAT family N-acetyltransferase [candidate division Zixibacteria bacterium]